MDIFNKLLVEELVKEFECINVYSEEMQELYERFLHIEDIDEAKPYLIIMRFFGWGTEQNQNAALTELKEIIKNGNNSLKGLFYDLMLKKEVENKDELLEALFQEQENGYTDKYLKSDSSLSEYSCSMLADIRKKIKKYANIIAVGPDHTIGIGVDGRLLSAGSNRQGQCNVSAWKDVIAISAGAFNTVALRRDGTVLFTGTRAGTSPERRNAPQWDNIIAISAGMHNTVGLKADGTVVAIGENKFGECNTAGWTDIIAISANGNHTVGLKNDGTVVAVGSNKNGECNVENWKDIVAISAGTSYTLGLTSRGKVLSTQFLGEKYRGQCEVDEWDNIVAISACACHSVGLKADGTVVATEIISEDNEGIDFHQNDVSDWKDVVSIKASGLFTVGIKSDGTVIAVGDNKSRQCEVSLWKVFDNKDSI